MQRDFTGRADLDFSPLYGKEFSRIFCISVAPFQRLMDIVMASGIQLYQPRDNRSSTNQVSLKAKLPLPLHCLTYGIPVISVASYFQMFSTMCLECYKQFDQAIKLLFHGRVSPTSYTNDLKAIVSLQKNMFMDLRE
jgi:hypothetical protein